MTHAPPTLAQKFAALLHGLTLAVAGRGRWWPWSWALRALLNDSLREIGQCFAEILEAGTDAPREASPDHPTETAKPTTKNPIRQTSGRLPRGRAPRRHRQRPGMAEQVATAPGARHRRTPRRKTPHVQVGAPLPRLPAASWRQARASPLSA